MNTTRTARTGGGFGDLRSVTTPAVVGTPNGNDFPDGKTTVYTYSTGFVDDRLNHNLLTITDPKGQTYLRNEYHSTTNPDDLNFDRIKRQTWGDVGDIIDVVYVAQTPTAENGFATIKVILNDRVGNVKEYFYDALNRGVIERELTGRADPDLPTTETENRPANQLRPDDPPLFETRYEWNSDFLQTRVIHPNGNMTIHLYESDFNSAAPARTRSNLRVVARLPGSHVPAGDQVAIVELFEYDTEFNGCCGSNFITRHTDGRGNVTTTTTTIVETSSTPSTAFRRSSKTGSTTSSAR